MEKQIKQVAAFHRAFGHPVASSLKHLTPDRLVLRHTLLTEEAMEMLQAGVKGDLVGVADAITDCLYILFGTAHEYGLGDKLCRLFEEVHRSNMSKLDSVGMPIYREDGKVMKSDQYRPPNLKDIVWDDSDV
jgi:predicted HAD superfamily Cof-like phosphohydrolase